MQKLALCLPEKELTSHWVFANEHHMAPRLKHNDRAESGTNTEINPNLSNWV